MQDEPIMDIAHLGHVEVMTPRPEESLRFFIDVMGMTESGRQGDSVFLRGWDDYERYSLKLTGSHTSGLGHAAFRTRSPQALERRVAALRASGAAVGWHEGELGHGPAFQFHDPDGHLLEIYYETEWYEAPPGLRPSLKNQAQRFPARGVNVRRLDHFNCLAADIKANREFFERVLGFRLTEQIVLDTGIEAGMMLERVKIEREKEARAAAEILGVADIQFWDLGDYPINLTEQALYRLVDVYRAIHPAFVLSHSTKDLYNHDHPAVTDFAQHARIIAQAHGHNPGQKVLGAPPVFLFEPHQPEQCDWKPDVLLDISAVWEKKRAAIECMAGQEHLWEYYTRVALQRGAQAARNSDKTIKYGEGYQAVFPHVVESLA